MMDYTNQVGWIFISTDSHRPPEPDFPIHFIPLGGEKSSLVSQDSVRQTNIRFPAAFVPNQFRMLPHFRHCTGSSWPHGLTSSWDQEYRDPEMADLDFQMYAISVCRQREDSMGRSRSKQLDNVRSSSKKSWPIPKRNLEAWQGWKFMPLNVTKCERFSLWIDGSLVKFPDRSILLPYLFMVRLKFWQHSSVWKTDPPDNSNIVVSLPFRKAVDVFGSRTSKNCK